MELNGYTGKLRALESLNKIKIGLSKIWFLLPVNLEFQFGNSIWIDWQEWREELVCLLAGLSTDEKWKIVFLRRKIRTSFRFLNAIFYIPTTSTTTYIYMCAFITHSFSSLSFRTFSLSLGLSKEKSKTTAFTYKVSNAIYIYKNNSIYK